MIAGATRILRQKVDAGEVHGVVGMGGFQGTSVCCSIMQALPYGLPKVLVSTMASGNTSNLVGIKDITMMFSVADIMGLNRVSREILGRAAGAIAGMAQMDVEVEARERPLVAGVGLNRTFFVKVGPENRIGSDHDVRMGHGSIEQF